VPALSGTLLLLGGVIVEQRGRAFDYGDEEGYGVPFRTLARNGAVTMDTNSVTRCAARPALRLDGALGNTVQPRAQRGLTPR